MALSEKKSNISVVVSRPISENSLLETSADEQDVFEVKSDGPDYRGVTCLGAAVLIAKAQFGLGVLGIPSTFSGLGLFPGLLCLIVLCFLSTWSGFIVGDFRLRHPQVYSIGDAAEYVYGKAGREFMGGCYWLFYMLVYAASLLTLSICFNTLGNHSACTVAWYGVGAVITYILGAAIRTMKVLSWMGYVALMSVFVSTWIVAIACLCESRPAGAAAGEVVNKNIVAFSSGKSFATIASSVAVQLVSLSSTGAYFTIHSEMRNPKQFKKSLLIGQAFVVANYIIIGVIIYGKIGDYVTSPALGSAGALFQKIGYGVAMPGLIFSCFYNAHFAAKYAFVRTLRKSVHLQANTFKHWLTWFTSVSVVVIIGFIVAASIPFFGDLLSLIGSLIGSIFMLILPGSLVLYDFRQKRKTVSDDFDENKDSKFKTMRNVGIGIFALCFGLFILVGGTYGSVQSILTSYKDGDVSSAFSCADNS